MALKPVDSEKNPGLAQLPEDVRNKMGFARKGGLMKKKMRKYEEGGDVVDETGMSFGTIKRNTETGELYDTETPKAKPKAAAKAEPKAESKVESKPVSNKPTSPVSSAREKTGFEIKKDRFMSRPDAEPSTTKTTEAKKSLSFPEFKESIKKTFSLPKSQRTVAAGMKAGGMVGSASGRGDGIAQRGKTKGRIV